ncbi:hypothetical protein GN244_ATG03452 [Phytophthora infestans]|uniref:Uncharacterized protein n=1 Tax=Phytophthora infestans TaxID=4787 RepID=A0A833TIQ7_PHYIN|nr:hypothetical protein GN244_ATG03452 [Phytophthora infestans]
MVENTTAINLMKPAPGRTKSNAEEVSCLEVMAM